MAGVYQSSKKKNILYTFRMVHRSELVIYHHEVTYYYCNPNFLQCKRLLLPDVSTPAGLEGYATATGARAVTGFGPWSPVAGFWRYSGATVYHKTPGQVSLRRGTSMLAFVSVLVMPQWVLLEQTHIHCKAGHHVVSISHSMYAPFSTRWTTNKSKCFVPNLMPRNENRMQSQKFKCKQN